MPSTVVRISVGGMDLVRAPASAPVIKVGRSSTCDVVMRAHGVKPINFIFHWHGGPTPNVGGGYWTVTDVGALTYNLTEPVRIGAFRVSIDRDALSPAPINTPVLSQIQRTIDMPLNYDLQTEQTCQLELVRVRASNGSMSAIAHVPHDPPEGQLPLAPMIKYNWITTHVLEILNLQPESTSIYVNGSANPVSHCELDFATTVQIHMARHTVFARLMPTPIIAPPEREFLSVQGRLKMVGSAIVTGLFFAMMSYLPSQKAPEPPPAEKRTARIEIKVNTPAEPPQQQMQRIQPPVHPVSKVPSVEKAAFAKPQVVAGPPTVKPVTAAPPPQPLAPVNKGPERAPAQTRQAAKPQPGGKAKDGGGPAATGAINPTKRKSLRSGLNNASSTSSDENVIGILGAVKPQRASRQQVRADTIINKGIIGKNITGDGGDIEIKQSASGILDESDGKSAKGGRNTTSESGGLASASTALSSDTTFKDGSTLIAKPDTTGKGRNLSAASSINEGNLGTGTSLGGSGSGSFEPGKLTASGGLDRDSVQKELDLHRNEIKNCYNSVLVTNSRLRGLMTFEWTILPSGSITSIRLVSSKIQSPTLEGCVIKTLKGLKFPTSPNGKPTVVVYPFIFKKVN